MNLSELIAKYGDDKVQFQNLDQCAETLNMNKGVTKITFGTEQPLSLDGTQKLGIVVWMDRKRVAKIIADSKLEGSSHAKA
ncbi:hypothetical protein [Rhizobium lusitanum]|uniref:Uncharacterized protein n=1 Tax=Rhizobium lusitanum TaxID=293958 RepID=A0A1C3VSM4_9HYPH|nr:hypothetical protein [Rhizobium lusitanum]SCB30729.1 hypothetical protein GA0061101_106148 [Rhizobium lusitanum]